MKVYDEYYVQKKNFVSKLSEVLNMAKPHLTCEYKLGEELPLEKRWCEFVENGKVVSKQVEEQPSGEFVIVHCANGYKYRVDVTANSLAAIAEEVFRRMVFK
jgi:hypothetical protein